VLSRSLILCFACGAVVSTAEQSPSAFEIRAPKIPGLKVEVGESAVIPDAKSAMAFGFKDGRICVYGDGTQSIWSEDHGKTWKPGSLGPSYKMTIQMSTGEVLSFQRDPIPRGDGKHTVRYQRSTDNWQTVQPGVVTLENGIMVCTYVRPGVWIIFSDDNCPTWEGATQIDIDKRYSYIVAAGPDSFMVFRERPDDRAIVATRFTLRKS
jgi:hypothetical protein